MTNYPRLNEINRNPGVPQLGEWSFIYDAIPIQGTSPTCVSLGAIGVTKNGVILFNGADVRGQDAVAREIVDEFGGHPAKGDYHFIPERLDR